MNIVFTCGGTGGHIYPAIAVARMFRERQPDCKILFIGAEDGMENKIVPREGFRLETVKISNYQRRLTPAAIWHNLVTVQRMAATFSKTKRILKDFQPDVIVGTGGYASFPALKMGAKLGIPTCVHESNAVPGLTTKLVARTASRVMVSFESSREHYPEPERVLLTGTPVREEFLFAKRQEARQALGLGDEPLVVSCWGSLGAREMNKKIAQFMKCECEDNTPFHHIHATGSFGWRWMPDYVREQGVDLAAQPRIEMREYIYDMPQVLAAADLIICRAGAATIAEVCASGTPCIMVPSPTIRKKTPGCSNAPARPQSSARQTATEKASMKPQSRSFQTPDGCAPCVPAHGIWPWSMLPSASIRRRSTLQSTDTHIARSA